MATIPGHHLRRSPIAYVKGQGSAEPWREELADRAEKLIAQFASSVTDATATASVVGFPIGSVEHRKQVEQAAIKKACLYLQQGGYAIESRQADKCGYDLLALRERDGSELHVGSCSSPLSGIKFCLFSIG